MNTSRSTLLPDIKSTSTLKKRTNVLKPTMANSRVDVTPSKMYVKGFLKVNRLYSDFVASRRILYDNINLLIRINKIQHNSGYVNSINRGTRMSIQTHLDLANKRAHIIQKENIKLGKRILQAGTKIYHKPNNKCENDRSYRLPVSPRIIEAFQCVLNVDMSEHSLIQKLLRPCVFIEVFEADFQYLGRITMELYTEACPELVLQIVRICCNNQNDKWSFVRIFSNLWIENELHIDSKMLCKPGFPYIVDCIDHRVGAGVLSFSQDFVNGFPEGILNFAISFKPLSMIPDRRIPFGRVIKGFKTLKCLEQFGTSRGRLRKHISIISTGVFN